MAKKRSSSAANTLIKRLLSAGVVFGMAMLVVSVIMRKGEGQVSGVNVQINPLPGGYSLIEEEDVQDILDNRFSSPVNSRSIGDINIERIERVLEEDPFVEDAEAFVDANNEININIVQNRPLIRVKDNNGLDYYLDDDALRMPPSKHYTARLLVATGNLPPHVPDFMERERSALRHVFELAKLLEQDEFLSALIEQVYVNNKSELVLAPKIGDQVILFGRFQEEKAIRQLNRLKIFYKEGLPYEGWRKYKEFDLRYDDQVVGRKG